MLTIDIVRELVVLARATRCGVVLAPAPVQKKPQEGMSLWCFTRGVWLRAAWLSEHSKQSIKPALGPTHRLQVMGGDPRVGRPKQDDETSTLRYRRIKLEMLESLLPDEECLQLLERTLQHVAQHNKGAYLHQGVFVGLHEVTV